MFTQPTTELVQWHDFKVKSEVDIVFEIAEQKGWTDCEVFGYGDMITEPMDSKGWELIPADIYEYSIPAEGVERVLETINAGVRIKGIIIADDKRSDSQPTSPAPEKDPLQTAEATFTFIGKALAGLFKAVVSVVAIIPMLVIGLFAGLVFDPKLIILVDDGRGKTVWISLLTWYE